MKRDEKETLVATMEQRVNLRLEALGLSAAKASKLATGGADAIRDIRKGSLPGTERLIGLSRALNCSLDYLLGLTDEPSSATGHNGPPENPRQLLARLDELNTASVETLREMALGKDAEAARRRLASHQAEAERLREMMAKA